MAEQDPRHQRHYEKLPFRVGCLNQIPRCFLSLRRIAGEEHHRFSCDLSIALQNVARRTWLSKNTCQNPKAQLFGARADRRQISAALTI